jgi:hypothetical protein
MTLRIPNVGEGKMLEHVLNKTAPENLVLRLFQNDVTPADTDVAGTYTEATFTGYSAITLTGSGWTVTTGAPSEAVYAQQSFTSTAGSQNQTVYGYYVTQATSGVLMWSERFGTSYTIQNNGDTIKVTPKFTAADTLD